MLEVATANQDASLTELSKPIRTWEPFVSPDCME